MIFWLLSCTTNTPTDVKESAVESNSSLVMAMVAFDYSVGSLAQFDLETETLTEDIASISGDPVVIYDEEAIWQLNRYQYDTLRKYSPAELRVPELEVSLAMDVGSSNPHDAEVCANNLFVSLFGSTELVVLDPDALVTIDTIDLQSWADEDGIPEASSIVQWNNTVFVGLTKLDRSNGFSPTPSTVIQVDCESLEVLNTWDIGSNIHLLSTNDQTILVTQGDESHQPGILSWRSDTDEWQRLWTSQSELSVTAVDENRLLYASLSTDMSNYQLNCVDIESGTHTTSEEINEFVTDLWIEDNTTGWMSTHWGWTDADNAQPGLSRIDLQTCGISQLWETQFAPYSIAFIPSQ